MLVQNHKHTQIIWVLDLLCVMTTQDSFSKKLTFLLTTQPNGYIRGVLSKWDKFEKGLAPVKIVQAEKL